MKLAAWISAPFAQPKIQGTRVSAPAPAETIMTPVEIVMSDDAAVIFRDALTSRHGAAEGAALVKIFDRMASVHPAHASMIVRLGSQGHLSFTRATAELRAYRTTGAVRQVTLGM